jgi:hypothetical protein
MALLRLGVDLSAAWQDSGSGVLARITVSPVGPGLGPLEIGDSSLIAADGSAW